LKEEGKAQTHAVLVASCEANRIDDIIIEIHNAGVELVTIHDRPEGSQLGTYNYIIEIENETGLPGKLLAKHTLQLLRRHGPERGRAEKRRRLLLHVGADIVPCRGDVFLVKVELVWDFAHFVFSLFGICRIIAHTALVSQIVMG
jgi:hypothetical protein